MFPVPTITCQRSATIYNFERFRQRGRLAALLAKLIGRYPYLEEFACYAVRLQAGRKYLGLQTIPVEKITGSLGRGRDFDREFRPLKKHLSDRWAAALLRSGDESWPPISVNKVGEKYFVEEGHHRVSVARFLGMVDIEAEVWEYAMQPSLMETRQPASKRALAGRAQPLPSKC